MIFNIFCILIDNLSRFIKIYQIKLLFVIESIKFKIEDKISNEMEINDLRIEKFNKISKLSNLSKP